MKFAALSLAACAALALSVGTASAQPFGHHHHGGYYGTPVGGHLDYHRGHYHYHNGLYRSGPLVPAYPAYNYSSYGYGTGFGLTVNRPGFNLSIGNGVGPFSNYNSFGYSPYGYGRRGW
jgi:hypothetical protein